MLGQNSKQCQCGNPDCDNSKEKAANVIASQTGVTYEVAIKALDFSDSKVENLIAGLNMGIPLNHFITLAFIDGYKKHKEDSLQ